MSATEESGNGGASAGIAQTVPTGRLRAPREPANERWAGGDGRASGELGRLAEVVRGDTMFVRVHLRTEALRAEVEHPRTTDWFEMARV